MSQVVGEPASTPKPEEAARPKATPRKQSKPGFCRAAGQCTLLFGHQGAHSFELNVGRDRCRKTAVVNMHGSDWRGPVEPTHNERRKQLQKRSSVTLGEQHEVEMLIAKRIADGEPRYLVRWAGKDQKEDSWEKATDIDAAAIEEFTYSKFKSATVKFRKVSQLWLIEQCLDRRIGPPSQSKVRWVGYGKRADQWVNDADIKLPTPAPPTVPSPFPSATSAFSPVDPARAHAREFGAATIASTGGANGPAPPTRTRRRHALRGWPVSWTGSAASLSTPPRSSGASATMCRRSRSCVSSTLSTPSSPSCRSTRRVWVPRRFGSASRRWAERAVRVEVMWLNAHGPACMRPASGWVVVCPTQHVRARRSHCAGTYFICHVQESPLYSHCTRTRQYAGDYSEAAKRQALAVS